MTSSARSRRITATRLATLFLATAGLLAGLTAPASADPGSAVSASAASEKGAPNAGQKIKYVALGDSYAYGLGANPATESYPALLDGRRDVVLTANRTAPGATTSDVLDSQLPTARGALKHADLVTLTVGGNDLNVIGIANTCTPGPAQDPAACAAALDRAYALVQPGGTLLPSIVQTLNAVAAAAPDARLVVTGYPLLVDPQFGLPGSPELNALVQQINSATLALNATVEGAVAISASVGIDVQFVGVVPEFLGQGIGSADSWIHFGNEVGYHPTADGYRYGYAAAITREVDFVELRPARPAQVA